MILYLVRHGEYTKDDPSEGLSEKGKKRIELLAKGMKTHDVKFKLLLSSPKKRAVETAAIIGGEMVTTELLKPNAEVETLHQFFESQGVSSILAVGHLPLLEDYVIQQTGDTAKFGAGSIAKITTHSEQMATLEWVLTPEEIAEDVQQ